MRVVSRSGIGGVLISSSTCLIINIIIIIIPRLPERHKPIELGPIKQQNSRKKSVRTKNTKVKKI